MQLSSMLHVPEELHQQIASLAAGYGVPFAVSITLPDVQFDPFGRQDRVGEVCMVVRRPNGRLLTATKTYYPPTISRLLTGGIAPGELIETALLREVEEETGLEVVIRRFLAVIEYTATRTISQLESNGTAHVDNAAHFCTFAFLLDEIGGVLSPQDDQERIAAFHEVTPDELPHLAAALEQVADTYDHEIHGHWRSWGLFRAIVHRVVYAALSDLTS